MKTANSLILCILIFLSAVISPAQENIANSVETTINTAQELLTKGDSNGAINILQKALEKNPKNEN